MCSKTAAYAAVETLEERYEQLERSGVVSMEQANRFGMGMVAPEGDHSVSGKSSKSRLAPEAKFPPEIQAAIEKMGLWLTSPEVSVREDKNVNSTRLPNVDSLHLQQEANEGNSFAAILRGVDARLNLNSLTAGEADAVTHASGVDASAAVPPKVTSPGGTARPAIKGSSAA